MDVKSVERNDQCRLAPNRKKIDLKNFGRTQKEEETNGFWNIRTTIGLFLVLHPTPGVVNGVGFVENQFARQFLHVAVTVVVRHAVADKTLKTLSSSFYF